MTATEQVGPFTHLAADLHRLLSGWQPPDESQEALRTWYLRHLARHPDAVAKSGPPAHFTASCLVLDPVARQVLLTHHRRARVWFQFGGHLEAADPSVRAAARREAQEESGIGGLVPWPEPVQLDRHPLVGDFERCREHLDIRFAAVVPAGTVPLTSAESLAVRWWPVDGLPQGADASLQRLVRAGLAHLARPDPTP